MASLNRVPQTILNCTELHRPKLHTRSMRHNLVSPRTNHQPLTQRVIQYHPQTNCTTKASALVQPPPYKNTTLYQCDTTSYHHGTHPPRNTPTTTTTSCSHAQTHKCVTTTTLHNQGLDRCHLQPEATTQNVRTDIPAGLTHATGLRNTVDTAPLHRHARASTSPSRIRTLARAPTSPPGQITQRARATQPTPHHRVAAHAHRHGPRAPCAPTWPSRTRTRTDTPVGPTHATGPRNTTDTAPLRRRARASTCPPRTMRTDMALAHSHTRTRTDIPAGPTRSTGSRNTIDTAPLRRHARAPTWPSRNHTHTEIPAGPTHATGSRSISDTASPRTRIIKAFGLPPTQFHPRTSDSALRASTWPVRTRTRST